MKWKFKWWMQQSSWLICSPRLWLNTSLKKLVARLMGWEVANAQQWLPREHSSSIWVHMNEKECKTSPAASTWLGWIQLMTDEWCKKQSVANWTVSRVQANMWGKYSMSGIWHSQGVDCDYDHDHDHDVGVDTTMGVHTIASEKPWSS